MARSVALLVVLGLLVAEDQPPTAYPIKLKDSSAGDVVEVDETSTEQGQAKVMDAAGKVLVDKSEYKIRTFAFREAVLEKPDPQKRPTKLRRQYTKAEVKTDGKVHVLPYQGQTVLIEKKDGKYRFQIEGGRELAGADAEYLDKEFNREKAADADLRRMLLPAGPVRVDESWTIDPAPLLKELTRGGDNPVGVDAANVKATGKLLKVHEKDGRQWGQMEYLVDVPLKEFSQDGKKLPLAAGSRITVAFAVDLCIDGSLQSGTIKGTVNLGASAVLPLANDAQGKLLLASRVVGHETRRELPRK